MIIVDRIENEIVICEEGDKFITIPKEKVIGKLREGAVIIKTEDSYTVDEDLTSVRKKTVFEKQKRLFNI